MRKRLDLRLVELKLVASRQEAQRLITEKQILVDGVIADKPARLVALDQNVILRGPKPKYVSRAGFKLEAALNAFGLEPRGWTCLDAGSSTGGFSDCLLQHGATKVIAVDVGTNQLHESIRTNPKIEVHEQTDIRKFDLKNNELCDLVVADVSFISLRLILAKLASFLKPDAPMIVLVKPQFEAGRQEVSKGKGIIDDPDIWARVLKEILVFATGLNLVIVGLQTSPIQGASGNVEFLACLKKTQSFMPVDLEDLITKLLSNMGESKDLDDGMTSAD